MSSEQSTVQIPAFLKKMLTVASKHSTRYSIDGVLVEVKKSGIRFVATDGRILGVFDSPPPEGDRPDMELVIPGRIIRALPTAKKARRTLQKYILTRHTDEHASIGLEGDYSITFKMSDNPFPPYRDVIPDYSKKKPDDHIIGFAGDVLGRACKLAEDAGKMYGERGIMKFRFRKRDKPALIKWESGSGESLTIVVMTVNVEDSDE